MNEIGKRGEDIATKYLEDIGYRILERNYRIRQGEIDIIAKENKILVIVEVKTRTNNHYGYPADAVDENKIKKIKKCCNKYIYSKKMESFEVRFDVIEVYIANEKNIIHHIKNSF